ncbi:MAG TPA: hypothetical protein VJB63_00635 [Patescibacteria group bacterium]|nr:hypothetical protein [Patescibacteria group bacterium]
MHKIRNILFTIGITLIVYILTKNPITTFFKLQFALLGLLAVIIYGYFVVKKTGHIRTMIMISAIFVLFLVAATGWFVSPFFFTLYLLAILLGFTFTPSTSVAFILTLTGLFSFDIGTIDIAYDYLTILSLLTVIPLTFYLRKEYLHLKEAEKEILVIRKDEKVYQNKVEDLLANKVNDFAVNLRQPINDTKQLAFLIKKNATHESTIKDVDRIIASAEESLRMLQEFEEKVTGKRLLKSPH